MLEDDSADISGLTEMFSAYRLGRLQVIAHDKELRENFKRRFPGAKILGSFKKLLETGSNVLAVKISCGAVKNPLHMLEIKRRCLEHDGEIIFVFAQNDSGLEELGGITGYLYDSEVNIPLNLKIGIALDRLLGVRS